jgi:hypothetical protein
LRYLVVTELCSVTQETLPQPAFAHSLEAPSEWKEFAPERANGSAQSQSQAPRGRGEQTWN